MRPEPLRHRIVSALQLQPMSAPKLSRCLSVTDQAVRESLADLTRRGIVLRRSGRPQVFEVRA